MAGAGFRESVKFEAIADALAPKRGAADQNASASRRSSV